MDVLAGEVVGILAHVERADEHRAGGFEPLDQRRIPLRWRQFAVDLGASAGRQTRDSACVLARAAVTSVKALSRGLSPAMRANAASVTAVADTSPTATARAMSSADVSGSIMSL
jgi:hypothetical protein